MHVSEETQYPELKGFYYIHEEVGHGGFGKVKLATHLLTGLKVAIKIIDKKAVGDDLPRVATEMDALRTLSHQNVCRLFQYIENAEKFFIIMEFCAGGEMFDYIVRKERLEESEARHFFRQLVQAMAYVHSKGYAHRDLKPENLLLTEDLHLKVIDFGLCAKPGILSNPLSTCCGSPAYAAPELIADRDYRGDRADVWSMGVLLYALVCGSLPFEEENTANLFMKIQKGQFYIPDYLTPSNRQLLSAMLTVDPEKRITMQQIMIHPWLNYKYDYPIKFHSIFDKNIVDLDIARELSYHHGSVPELMIMKIKEWKFDYLTASYYLLLHEKRRGNPYNLRPPAVRKGDPNMIGSPTIHASLERNLDRLDLNDSETSDLSSASSSERDISAGDVRFTRPLSPDRNKKISYVNAMLNMPNVVCTGRSPQQKLAYDSPSGITPVRNRTNSRQQASFEAGAGDKENRAATMRIRGPIKIVDDGTMRPKSIYSTPQRPALKSLFSPGGSRQRAQSSDRACSGSPVSVGSGSGVEAVNRTPRSTTKTPRLRQRVFASLERKKELVINLLTPRKLRNDSPQVLKTAKGMVNVSMTSSTDPERVKAELVKVFESQNMQYDVNGWKITGRKIVPFPLKGMTVELEVVIVESLGYVGIKRKRLSGDAFKYKKICELVLQMAGL